MQRDIPFIGNKKDILLAFGKADTATVVSARPDGNWWIRAFEYFKNLNIGYGPSTFGILLNGQYPGVKYIGSRLESGLN